jgi:hypothetical protein
VGSKGGVEPLVHALRALLTEFKILKLDFVNAFNEVERGAVIDEVRATFPELSPFVTWVYGTPSDLLVTMDTFEVERVLSQRGVRQGCPLSPLLFSLVMRVILRQLAERMAPRIVAGLRLASPSQQGAQADEPERPFVPESLAKLSSSAYLDDVFQLCGSRTTADGDFARAETQCAKLAPSVGLRLSEKPGMCQLLDREILQAERECVEVLGAHFGHPDAIEIELRSAVAKMEGAVQRLRRWYRAGHAHGALAVLRVCQLPSMSHSICTVSSAIHRTGPAGSICNDGASHAGGLRG